jgi:cell pole-organizing protein PopZ
MEEILASIRRIISDDEQNPTRNPAAAQSHQDDESLELVEGEADDAPEPVEAEAIEEEEDILDLTAELGGLEPVEEPLDADVVEMVEIIAEAAPAEAPPPEIIQPAPARPQLQAVPTPPPVPAPEPEAPAPAAPPPPPMTASEEAATALERAIAALRAGQLPTSFAEFTSQPAAQPEPVPEPAPEPEPEPATFAAEPEPEFEPEPDLVLTEFEAEVIIDEPVFVEAVESEPQQAPAWEAEAPSFAAAAEREAEVPRSNGGGSHHYAPEPMSSRSYAPEAMSPRTLEDSVKDMLRPMLRQWLDENMARVLTAALQDELRDNPARLERD